MTSRPVSQKPTNRMLFTFMIAWLKRYWRGGRWHKLVVGFVFTVLVLLAGMYGIARWYIATESSKPLEMGVSFIPAYAESLGLDAKQTMQALVDEVHVRHFRLVSYWDQLEPAPGQYDFSLLDWQFVKAEQAHATVTLSVGLRQPRWPECHMPTWAQSEPEAVWQPQLEAFISQVVERYKDSPALQSYQVENEFFLKGFGLCTNFDRSRLVSEYNLVKKLDPQHTAIINRSNNALGWPTGAPQGDKFGVSVYKRVWEPHLRRYIEYPFPAWYYAFLSGWQKMMTGRGMLVHELQAEVWTPHGQSIQETPLEEQNKSFNAERFKDRIGYGKGTGVREMYLWGAEYWYYRKEILHDSSVWEVAEQEFDPAQLTD